MKLRIKTTVILFSLLSFIACDKETTVIEDPTDDPIENPSEEPTDQPEKIVTDLGEKELANCYIVQEEGIYKFAADNQFNLGEGLPVPPQISPVSAGLIWQTVPNSIKSVELIYEDEKPYIKFEVTQPEGNALIAVFNDNGDIEWSWHIWMPLQEIEAIHSSTGYDVMNINLGALTNEAGDACSYGMLYQWGRKDPFPAAATLTGTTSTVSAPMYDMEGNTVLIQNSDWGSVADNTIEYAIAHPTVCLSNYGQFAESRDWLNASYSDDSLWGNPNGTDRDSDTNAYVNKGRKTCYDPSPAGWRVPPCDVFLDFTSTGGYAWEFVDFNIDDVNNDGILDLDDYNYGWHFLVNKETPLYFPAAARFDGSYAMLMGSMSGLWGNYWSNSPYGNMAGGAVCALAFQVKDMTGEDMITISPSAAGSKADAYSIRCIKD